MVIGPVVSRTDMTVLEAFRNSEWGAKQPVKSMSRACVVRRGSCKACKLTSLGKAAWRRPTGSRRKGRSKSQFHNPFYPL